MPAIGITPVKRRPQKPHDLVVGVRRSARFKTRNERYSLLWRKGPLNLPARISESSRTIRCSAFENAVVVSRIILSRAIRDARRCRLGFGISRAVVACLSDEPEAFAGSA